jgi:YVTN family beta-propeller protein
VRKQLRGGEHLRLYFLSAFALAALLFATSARSALAQDAYVANYGSDDVSVIDTQSDEVVGSPIAVGSEPEAIAITPDAKTAYVVNFGSDDVSVIDTETNQVIGSPIGVGSEPVAIAISPDGKRAYVVNSGAEDITVIDTQSDQVVGSPISVGKRPWGIAISPDGKRAYVAVDGPQAVSVIDTETNQVIGSPIGVGTTPIPIAISPDGKTAYVANYEENDVSVIDTQTDEVSGAPIKVGIEPWGIAISPDGKTAYVANEQEESVSVIDTQTNQVLGSPIKVGSEPYVVTISPDGKRAYVPNFGTDTVSVIDTQTNQVLGSPIKVGNAPAAIAIPPDQAPIASFTAPVGRAGAPLSFDASASSYPEGSTPSYDWEFGDGTKAEDGGPSPSHTYSAPGVYEATLRLSDSVCSSEEIFTGQTAYCGGGAPASQTQPITVAADHGTHLALSLSPTSILANGSSTTTATATVSDANGNPVSGESLGFTSSDGGEKIGPVGEPEPGTYSATVTASRSPGTASITAIDDSALPSISAHATLTQTSTKTFALGRVKRIVGAGTAELFVVVPGPGDLSLLGARVVRQHARDVSGAVRVMIVTKGETRRRLREIGTVVVKVTVAFTPVSGMPLAQSERVKLIMRGRHR